MPIIKTLYSKSIKKSGRRRYISGCHWGQNQFQEEELFFFKKQYMLTGQGDSQIITLILIYTPFENMVIPTN